MYGMNENNLFHILAARAAFDALNELVEKERLTRKTQPPAERDPGEPRQSVWTWLEPKLRPMMRALRLVES